MPPKSPRTWPSREVTCDDPGTVSRSEPDALWLKLKVGYLVRDSENRIRQPPPETLVVHELLEQLRVILQHGGHHARQCLVVLDAGVLLVRILLGVLVSLVRGDPVRDVLSNQLVHSVRIC